MRKINAIVIHGAWTPPTADIGVAEITKWHTDPKEKGGRGWGKIGYHFVIRRNGLWEVGRPVAEPGAHVAGNNDDTIGVCLVGGKDSYKHPHLAKLDEFAEQEVLWEFNYTAAQMDTLYREVLDLKTKYGASDILGHRDYKGVAKRCPGFDVRAFFK